MDQKQKSWQWTCPKSTAIYIKETKGQTKSVTNSDITVIQAAYIFVQHYFPMGTILDMFLDLKFVPMIWSNGRM